MQFFAAENLRNTVEQFHVKFFKIHHLLLFSIFYAHTLRSKVSRQTDILAHSYERPHTPIQTKTDTQTDSPTLRQTHTEPDTQTHRHTHTDRHRVTKTKTYYVCGFLSS